MKLTKQVDYELDFQGKWVQWSAALMGAFLFLRMVYYFGLYSLTDWSSGTLWLELILPMVLSIGYIVLLRGLRLNMPLIIGGLGAAVCVLLMILELRTGVTFWSVLTALWYLAAGAVLVATVMGFLSNRLILLLAFALPVLIRFLVIDLSAYVLELRLAAFLPELSVLCVLASFACLAPGLRGRKPVTETV